MDVYSLLASTVLISVSGVFSPGPLTASAIAVGTKEFARGGFLVALGHMIFELPYVIILSFIYSLINSFLMNINIRYIFAFTISGFITFFSYMIIRDGVKIMRGIGGQSEDRKAYIFNPVLTGILLTGLNPYFLSWWLSVGLPLIQSSLEMGFSFLFLMYLAHIWLDYFWLTFMGFIGENGVKILKSKAYGALLTTLGLVLALFAVNMLFKTVLNINILPL
ncbi:MAG: LysE family transporter [Candidatus Bathyarchaeia archaeon]